MVTGLDTGWTFDSVMKICLARSLSRLTSSSVRIWHLYSWDIHASTSFTELAPTVGLLVGVAVGVIVGVIVGVVFCVIEGVVVAEAAAGSIV